MGVVYKARQEKVNRLVALKMVLGSSCASPEARLRFLLEGEVLGRLQHPHIVQIYEVGTWEGQPYFALEYVEGGTLADTLKQHPPTPTEAAALIEQLARAVHYAHSNGVIHRDLKPANILLTLSRAPEARAGG
jgi:serine/threonine-protein kinase